MVLQVRSRSLPCLRFLTLSFTPPPQHGSCTEAAEKRRWEAPQLQREQAIFSRAASQLLGCRQGCAAALQPPSTSLHPAKALAPARERKPVASWHFLAVLFPSVWDLMW